MQICRLVIFPHLKKLIIQRDEKFGGTIQYASYEDLEKDYSQGKLHPLDLKQTTAKSLEPILIYQESWNTILDVFKNQLQSF